MYWKARYDTVFDRARALGLTFAGPQHPNGRQADPWPTELPTDSPCVPTFHHSRQRPATASRQLDFVFVSAPLASAVTVTALNKVGEWGPSDHCRILIEIDI
jgi:endonuclease/exonuclease/phosphatase family metal-dependent hydrolase